MVQSVSRHSNTSCLWLNLKSFHESNKRWLLMQFTAWGAESKGTKGAANANIPRTPIPRDGHLERKKKGRNKSKRLKIWWRAASSDWRDLQHRSSASMMLLTTHEGHGELRQDRWFPTPRCPVCCRTCAHQQGGVCSVPENHQMARVVQPRDTSLPDGQPDSPRTSWQEDNMAAPFVEDQMLKRQPLLLISSHTFSVGRALYKKRKKRP